MKEIGIKALAAKDFLSTVTTQEKNKALLAIAQSLRNSSETIINEKPVKVKACGALFKAQQAYFIEIIIL